MQKNKTLMLIKMLNFVKSSMFATDDGDILYNKTDENAVIALGQESFYYVTKSKAWLIKEGILHSKERIDKKITFKVDKDKLEEALESAHKKST